MNVIDCGGNLDRRIDIRIRLRPELKALHWNLSLRMACSCYHANNNEIKVHLGTYFKHCIPHEETLASTANLILIPILVFAISGQTMPG